MQMYAIQNKISVTLISDETFPWTLEKKTKRYATEIEKHSIEYLF